MATRSFTEPPEFIPLDGSTAEQPKPPRPIQEQVQWLDLRAAVEQDPPRLDFVLPGIKRGVVGALVATGGVGKTMIAVQMSITVASGCDLLNLASLEWECKPGKVVFFTGEDDLDVLHGRIHAIGLMMHQTEREKMYKNLSIGSLVGLQSDVMSHKWQCWFAEKTKDARLVVFDTLRRFHNLDENDNGLMASLIGWMESLCRQNGITVLFLHHTNKTSSGADVSQQASRGASVLTDNARFQANMVTMSEKEATTFRVDPELRRWFVKLCFTKLNYSKPLPDLWFKKTDGGALEVAQFSTSYATCKKGDENW